MDSAVVGPMLSDPEEMEHLFAGRGLDVSVLFSDLQGFTQLTRQRTGAGRVEFHLIQLNTYLDRTQGGRVATRRLSRQNPSATP